MDPLLEQLAGVRLRDRLAEAEGLRRGRRHVAARRLGRKAEDVARRVRVAPARTL
ncbi:hypothetical protein [Nocardioides cynanchi]|uniref:hypothetical protein n=1 Tax=Nocardioides cynanchi TaxID=2558918 RepID=UPI00178286CB|nr:hypothetical protein [Nocardioides cynanchi]